VISRHLLILAIPIFLVSSVTRIVAEQAATGTNNSIDLNGLTYTVTNVFVSQGSKFIEAKDDELYVIVRLSVKNPKPKMVRLNTEFNVIDGDGLMYDLDFGASFFMEHGLDMDNKVMPRTSKLINIVFKVPMKRLNGDKEWALLVPNENDENSPGTIKLGKPIGFFDGPGKTDWGGEGQKNSITPPTPD